jgi:hypothetical protein
MNKTSKPIKSFMLTRYADYQHMYFLGKAIYERKPTWKQIFEKDGAYFLTLNHANGTIHRGTSWLISAHRSYCTFNLSCIELSETYLSRMLHVLKYERPLPY